MPLEHSLLVGTPSPMWDMSMASAAVGFLEEAQVLIKALSALGAFYQVLSIFLQGASGSKSANYCG